MIRTAGGRPRVAKTGTTRESSALSGIVKGRYAFSILQNGSPVAALGGAAVAGPLRGDSRALT